MLLSTKALTQDGYIDVSLTSYGPRLSKVFATIESIGLGTQRPRAIILWVDRPEDATNPHWTLRMQQKRGLQIRYSEGEYGPHKKYYPYCCDVPSSSKAMVTADDDVLYPPCWLTVLARAHVSSPGVVHCFRAYEVQRDSEGNVAPYHHWLPTTSTLPSFDNFATGVSGVIYSLPHMEALRQAGENFLEVSHSADDVWLYFVLTRAGFRIRQVESRSRLFWERTGTQSVALSTTNVDRGMNDVAIERTRRAFGK
ncbi:glycosyltransferase [Rhodococcoides kroppenstedtii]|uniref:glycosyltransferase n=1 Tax=Rhodococcoides kroppenstedtii TaxID=293050 RepID=UPI001BDF5721|nr:glycosyltransferase [Rhodococcus kroppenstedtii]MBT1191863.1 glycosyltransferase [Rhodococcus kroppenstedtii]